MGAFETKTATKTSLPADVPEATAAVAEGHPDGAIYKASDGKRFRLRHARWVTVLARKPKAAAGSKPTK